MKELDIQNDDTVVGFEVRLQNRRVTVLHPEPGRFIVEFKRLVGWKNIRQVVVPLSREGFEALVKCALECIEYSDKHRTFNYND